eukprot:scaffold96027_cov75-Phaeocystis_antarctica.AAC.2
MYDWCAGKHKSMRGRTSCTVTWLFRKRHIVTIPRGSSPYTAQRGVPAALDDTQSNTPSGSSMKASMRAAAQPDSGVPHKANTPRRIRARINWPSPIQVNRTKRGSAARS